LKTGFIPVFSFNQNHMQDLVERLKAAGLTEAQAYAAIGIVKDFTKEKFPMFGSAIDKLFDKYKPKDENDFLD
jgi:hypothetical protein